MENLPLKISGVVHEDFPLYRDAYIVSGDYKDRPLTEEEIEFLNHDQDFIIEKIFEKIDVNA
jgi:hypothetical protein